MGRKHFFHYPRYVVFRMHDGTVFAIKREVLGDGEYHVTGAINQYGDSIPVEDAEAMVPDRAILIFYEDTRKNFNIVLHLMNIVHDTEPTPIEIEEREYSMERFNSIFKHINQ